VNKQLEVGDKIAIVYGNDACMAKVVAVTNENFLIRLNFGIDCLMTMNELVRRQYVIVEGKKESFIARFLNGLIAKKAATVAITED